MRLSMRCFRASIDARVKYDSDFMSFRTAPSTGTRSPRFLSSSRCIGCTPIAGAARVPETVEDVVCPLQSSVLDAHVFEFGQNDSVYVRTGHGSPLTSASSRDR